ncbi:hypothetical protein [Bradyrhizobium sp. 27S5]|uniref:hypothetical protein n=1 Tax=Bradyrhizobium sp. 27S5 TaxID=3139728 RepID=UPI0030D10BFB
MATFEFKRRHIWWGLTSILGAACIVAASLFVHIWYAFSAFGACRNVVLGSVPSPDGKRSVVIFRKECGATVADSTHASIVSTGGTLSPESSPPFFSVGGDRDVLVTWRGEHVVKIGLIPGTDRFYKRELTAGNVNIEYE